MANKCSLQFRQRRFGDEAAPASWMGQREDLQLLDRPDEFMPHECQRWEKNRPLNGQQITGPAALFNKPSSEPIDT